MLAMSGSCQDLRHTLENSGMGPAHEWEGTQDGVRDIRRKLNLLVGSPVTVAWIIGDGVGVKSETDGDSASSAVGLE